MRTSARRSRAVFAVVVTGAIASAALAGAPAGAQAQAPSPEAPQAGVRIVSGQSAIVGGNGAGARERALDEAFRQAIDQSLAEMLDAPTRASEARALKGVEARARTYVRRYRALEEGEVAGAYAVKLEVEVDELALRRATERLAGAAPGAPGPAPGLLVVAGAASEAASPLLTALVKRGARAQLADISVTDATTAMPAAARAALTEVAFLTAEARAEGAVRGTSAVAVSCRLVARVVLAPGGQPVAEAIASPRAFAEDDAAARARCFAQAADELTGRLAPSATAPAAGDELRAVTVDADVVEAAAVVALLKDLRSIGSVSSAEVRRIGSGRAEIRARTRAPASALAPALSRDAAGTLVLSNLEVAGDVIRVRARLRPVAAASGAP